jgi:NAD(P) transhydrogenase subunit beta
MSQGLVSVCYVVASVLFILSLGGLSQQETAKRGNYYGIAGITIAIAATIAGSLSLSVMSMITAMAIGGIIGAFVAARVAMTEMPQLVAILHSFVGLAAVFVGFAGYVEPLSPKVGVEHTIHLVEIFLGIFIGAVTFTGSIIAFGKLHGKISSKALTLPGRHLMNLGLLVASLALGAFYLKTDSMAMGITALVIMTLLAFVLGVHLVMAIGGADMPVVVSMLNS